jgi:hypothetical protein
MERGGSVVEQLELHEQDSKLVGQINQFQVHPLEKGWAIHVDPRSRYGAQEMPEDIRRTLHAGQYDHALIQWEEPVEQQSRERLDELGQSELGKFLRDAQGRIYVTRPGPRIIGGRGESGDVQVGHVAALLKPTASPDLATSSPGEAAQSPSAESPNEAIDLYNRLLGLVGGSRRTATGLVEYERRQAPHASLPAWIDRAIARLLRDRRSTN